MELKYIILLSISLIIIFSYMFDAFARKTKFPSVILLIATGILARAISDYFLVEIPDYFKQIISVMGTIGLILIVLEGALELTVNKSKIKIIGQGLASAFVILILCIIGLTAAFHYGLGINLEASIINSIPLSVISSAVAIPSAAALSQKNKEFVVYESTFSDILGIMAFNYAMVQLQAKHDLLAINHLSILSVEIIGIVFAAMLITWLMFELMERIAHTVKFFLFLAILIGVYAIGGAFHLPSLVIIFVFGLYLSNTQSLLPNFIKKYISITKAESGLHEFHILTAESTFIVRTFFFLFFGFTIQLESFMDWQPYLYGGIILLIMFAVRFLYLFIFHNKNVFPLLFMSPRGLITILLFLQITSLDPQFSFLQSEYISQKVLLVVILGSMLIMLIGTIYSKNDDSEEDVLLTDRESFAEIQTEGNTVNEFGALEEENKSSIEGDSELPQEEEGNNLDEIV